MAELSQAAHRAKAARAAKSPAELINAASLPALLSEIPLIAARLAEMPKTSRNTYLKAMKGKSMGAAIKAHCSECMGWDRNEVRNCTAPACPLYPYRPFR